MDPRAPTPELLAPAGDFEKLHTAVRYGADAVYLGGPGLNLRSGAEGFSHEELPKALDFAHRSGVRVYYLLNILPRQNMLGRLKAEMEFLQALVLEERGPDAIIAADVGVARMARKELPEVPLHVSTQANTANSQAIRFWKEYGARRVNVARELRSAELMDLLSVCRRTDCAMELEMFVHGAQCMAISGHCYLSAYLNDRPANLGRCSHPCRYGYRVDSLGVEEAKLGERTWEVREYWQEVAAAGREAKSEAELEGYSEFFAAQDLCLIHYLDWMARMGVAAVKVEGRTKSSSYLAQVTDAYATALKDLADPNLKRFAPERYLAELVNTASRPLSTGFFDAGHPRIIAQPPGVEQVRPVVARVLEALGRGRYSVEVKHCWDTRSHDVEILVPGLSRPRMASKEFGLETRQGVALGLAHPGQKAVLITDRPEIMPDLFLRRAWGMEP